MCIFDHYLSQFERWINIKDFSWDKNKLENKTADSFSLNKETELLQQKIQVCDMDIFRQNLQEKQRMWGPEQEIVGKYRRNSGH